MNTEASTALTRDIIARVRKIEIRTRRIVDELTGGAYHSVFKGRGMEFDEVREYQAGDDIRTIDWNVTARMGFPFIKKFVEERELTVFLLVDMSASGDFGSRGIRKREQAAELAALLAFSAIRNHDRVGLLLFTEQTELYLPPRKGRRHVLRLIRELLAFKRRRPRTCIRQALETFMQVSQRRSIAFLISDFLDKDYQTALSLANIRHDVVALRILDQGEQRFQLPFGQFCVEDAETGEILTMSPTFSAKTRQDRLQQAARQMHETTAENCRRAGVDFIQILNGEDYVGPLMQFFRNRERRRRTGRAR